MERAEAEGIFTAEVRRGAAGVEAAEAHGQFTMRCVGADGQEKWTATFDNIVTTVGKNLALDTILAGAAYTVVGPFLGLIGAITTGPVVGDTMASHSGWVECGNANDPDYTAPRKTAAFSAASGGVKALTAAAVFAILTTGTVNGAFLVYGPGAVNTIDSTAGVLYSAGTFTGKSVGNGDSLSVTWSASL
jgi:hypothetical protein